MSVSEWYEQNSPVKNNETAYHKLYSLKFNPYLCVAYVKLDDTVREQYWLSQNMSLYHEDHFRLIIFKKQATLDVFLFTSP